MCANKKEMSPSEIVIKIADCEKEFEELARRLFLTQRKKMKLYNMLLKVEKEGSRKDLH